LLALFFAGMVISGRLYYYIGPRFGWLSVLAAGMFAFFAATYGLRSKPEQDHNHDHDGHDHHDHGPIHVQSIALLLVPAVPLVLAVLVPARPLGATAASSRGISLGLPSSSVGSTATLDVEPESRTVLDWARAMNASSDPAALDGELANVIGFVYRDIRFKSDQFMVSRFTITCCVADALAIGVVVDSPKASQYTADSWVRVTGSFAKGELDGKAMPVLVADGITPIQPPQEPYLYP
jgi:uncharacterized repeat protein (TIGR03943 family)